MEIRVDEARERGDGTWEVGFSCRIGRGLATWAKGSRKPVEGQRHCIEMDIADWLDIGRNAEYSSAEKYEIFTTPSGVFLRGTVEAMDDDGMVFFRLGDDCLFMIESALEDIEPGIWLLLTTSAVELKLTPIGG
jgi:hypothetical protein